MWGFARAEPKCLNLLNGSAIAMPSTSARPATQESNAQNGGEPTIVGLWDTKFMSDNQLVDGHVRAGIPQNVRKSRILRTVAPSVR